MCLQFLPRDVMHITRTMLLQDVRPSVRLSVPYTPVLCRNGQTYHYTFFTNFHTVDPITPLHAAASNETELRKRRKNGDFQPLSPYIS